MDFSEFLKFIFNCNFFKNMTINIQGFTKMLWTLDKIQSHFLIEFKMKQNYILKELTSLNF